LSRYSLPNWREYSRFSGFAATAVRPLLEARKAIEQQVGDLDRKVLKLARHDVQVRRFMTAPGVGPITALCFKATIDDPTRFKRSRSVGAYVGLTTRRHASGVVDWSGRISARPLKRTALLAKPVNGINAPQRPDCVADDAVSCEPVSAPNSLLTGKLTGNFAESGDPSQFSRPIKARIQSLTAEFPTQPNREFLNAYQGISLVKQGNLVNATAKPLNWGPTSTRARSREVHTSANMSALVQQRPD
jgi:hypothetical protein